MNRFRAAGRGVLVTLLCVVFAAWAAKPDLAHLPKLVTVLADHAETVAEHGRSHGLEEDLHWALHGHSHDQADHDHGTEVLPTVAAATTPPPGRLGARARPARDGPSPVSGLERPPRA